MSDTSRGEYAAAATSSHRASQVEPEHTIEELTKLAIVRRSNQEDTEPALPEDTDYPPLPESARLDPGLGASASPWLDEYIRFSRKWAPRAYPGFHEAIALWLLAIIAARRVGLQLGGERITSLYIALCSRTSLFTKSTAARLAQIVLRELGLGWFLLSDSLTPQRFIHEMSGYIPDNFDKLTAAEQDRIKTSLAFSGKRGWFYDEFGEKVSAMMRQNNVMADFRGHFRRLDDGSPSFQYATMSRGIEQIGLPYLALLTSLTPADLRPFAQPDGPLWHDGFFARFAFVSPPISESSSRGRFPKGELVVPKTLLAPLERWHLRLEIPEVKVTPGKDGSHEWSLSQPFPRSQCILGSGVYEAFYRYGDALLDLIEDSWQTHLDGSYARFPEKALRIAMLLASLENDGVIELSHWARAQEITERWRRDLHNLVAGLNDQGPSKAEEDENKVFRQLIRLCAKSGKVTARQIGQHIHGMDTATAERYLDILVRSGAVKRELGQNTVYYFPIDG